MEYDEGYRSSGTILDRGEPEGWGVRLPSCVAEDPARRGGRAGGVESVAVTTEWVGAVPKEMP